MAHEINFFKKIFGLVKEMVIVEILKKSLSQLHNLKVA